MPSSSSTTTRTYLTAGEAAAEAPLRWRRHSVRDPDADPGAAWRRTTIAAILLDMNFGPGAAVAQQGFEWLATHSRDRPGRRGGLITAHGGVDVAVEAMKHGATISSPSRGRTRKLVATLSAAVQAARQPRRGRSAQAQPTPPWWPPVRAASDAMLGESPDRCRCGPPDRACRTDGCQRADPRRKRHRQGTGAHAPSTTGRAHDGVVHEPMTCGADRRRCSSRSCSAT